MNSRDRVKMALRCRKPDRIPRALGFFPQAFEAAALSDAEEQFALDVRYAEFNAPTGQNSFMQYLDQLPTDVHLGSSAQLQTYFEWNYHPESASEGPLGAIRSLAELKEYVLPDLTHPDRYKGMEQQISQWHEAGLAVAGSPPHLGGVLFEIAIRLRGFEQISLFTGPADVNSASECIDSCSKWRGYFDPRRRCCFTDSTADQSIYVACVFQTQDGGSDKAGKGGITRVAGLLSL